MSGIDGRDVMALITELKELVAVQKQIAERLDWFVKEVRASNQIKKEEKEHEIYAQSACYADHVELLRRSQKSRHRLAVEGVENVRS